MIKIVKTDIIHNTDVQKVLEMLSPNSVDLIFFDPPYNKGKDYGVYKDNKKPSKFRDWIIEIVEKCKEISKRGIGLYTNWELLKFFWHKVIPEAEPIIIYKKSSGVVKSEKNIIQHHHAILTTAESLLPNLKSVWDDIRVFGEGYLFNEDTFKHPAPTSLKATKRYIKYFSKEKEIVFDPFLGIGTTAVACKMLNRRYIGSELNSEYINTTEKRLKRTRPEDNRKLSKQTIVKWA
jgi:site-specific DNA-methyltransferase (adenine-specific)